jgi:hypothetical protein
MYCFLCFFSPKLELLFEIFTDMISPAHYSLEKGASQEELTLRKQKINTNVGPIVIVLSLVDGSYLPSPHAT